MIMFTDIHGNPVWINPIHVSSVCIAPFGMEQGKTHILCGTWSHYVEEPVDEVARRIVGERRVPAGWAK